MKVFWCLIFILLSYSIKSQDPVYKWNWRTEKYVIGSGLLLNSVTSVLKWKADKITAEQILNSNPLNVNSFDRSAIYQQSHSAQIASDILGNGVLVVPFIFYLSNKGKHEGMAVAGMAVEAGLFSAGIIDVMKVSFSRHRPYTYNSELSLDKRIKSTARLSYPSGHTATASTFSFLSASIFSDLYPDSRWKPVIWSAAAILPGLTGYFRYRSGNHFPTDVITGYILGAGIGLLVPHLHRGRDTNNDKSLIIMRDGVSLNYKF